jgi:Spy/CpxP family protein refolding chaperone
MKRWVLAGIAVLLGALALHVLGRAQGEEGGGAWGRQEQGMGPRLLAMLENDRVRTELGITDQQAERLRQIAVDTEKFTVKTRAEIAVRNMELRELLRADKPEREAVMNKVQEISDLRGQIMKQHIESLLATKTVLTPEQQRKMRARLEHRGRPGAWRERFRPQAPGAPAGPPEPPAPPPVEPPVE